MLGLGQHAGFIMGAYGVTLAIVAGLLCWVYADARIQKRLLADLEARGITRRSARKRASGEAAARK